MAKEKEVKIKTKTVKKSETKVAEKNVNKKSVKTNSKKDTKKNVKKDVKKNNNKKSYIQEIKAELNKVKWPTKKEMIKYSIAVLIFIVVFGLYFYGVDALFAWISSLVKGL